MTDIPFITPEQLQTARDMEKYVLTYSESLVLFVGVRVVPISGGVPTYYVTVGCPLIMDPKACASGLSISLKNQWKSENIEVTAFRGVLRKST